MSFCGGGERSDTLLKERELRYDAKGPRTAIGRRTAVRLDGTWSSPRVNVAPFDQVGRTPVPS